MPFSKPVWIEEGPGPLALPTSGYSIAAGAIQAVAADPIDSQRLFVATCGGGIWATIDASSANGPSWMPLSDQLPSLSMSAIAIDSRDPQRNTIWAGCGATSHASPLIGGNSGPLLGLFMSTDGGQTWTELGRSVFQGNTINQILPTGSVILAATAGVGLQRSIDTGQHWTAVGAAIGNAVSDVVADPSNPLRVYAASMAGVFRSDDGGDVQWTDISAGLGSSPFPFIKLSVSRTADARGVHHLYAVGQGMGLWVSTNFGATWTRMGSPPDNSNPVPPMEASPLFPNVVFCTSDSGLHWMVTATGSMDWTQLDFTAATSNTSPHTDGRGCAFSADGNTWFETDDGGIYRLINAHAFPGSARKWEPAIGNIRITEFHSIAYDAVHHILIGAAQDNCVPQQTIPGGIDWQINEDPTRDGFKVAVDETSMPGASIHYSSQQSLFQSRRRTYTSATTVTSDVPLGLDIEGTHYNRFEGAIRSDGSLGTVRWNQDFALNRADPRRMLIGTDYLYESFDRGDNFASLCGVGQNSNGEPMPINPIGTVTAYAYGHAMNHDVVWLGAGGVLRLRTAGAGLPARVATYPGSTPVGIALAAEDWRRAYVLDATGRVWRTSDAGATANGWRELTGNLLSLSGDLRVLEVYQSKTPTSHEHIFVGGQGGVYVTTDPRDGAFAFWQKYGRNLPNALITDIHYCSKDDVLVAGTLGRAAFSMRNVTGTLIGAPTLAIQNTGRSGCYGGWIAGTDVTFYPVITGYTFLDPPLTFDWKVAGAANTKQFVPTQVVVTMPPVGQRVDVTLTIRDATGYELFAYRSDAAISTDAASKRAALCALVDKIRTTAIVNWPIDPLGPPIRYADFLSPAAFGEAAELFEKAARLLRQLQRAEKNVASRVVAPPSRKLLAAWRAMYPKGELGAWSVPVRMEEEAGGTREGLEPRRRRKKPRLTEGKRRGK